MGVVVGAVVLGACGGGSDDPSPFTPNGDPTTQPSSAQPNALEAALQQGTGVPWAVDVDAVTGFALFAKPLKRLTVGGSSAEVGAFIAKYPQVFGVRSEELGAPSEGQDTDGRKVVELHQQVGANPVFGTSVAVHLAADGAVTFVGGHGYRPVGPVTTARTPSEAQTAAVAAAKATPADAAPAELVLLPFPSRTPKEARLAFRVDVSGESATGGIYFLDATTLAVLLVQAAGRTVDGSGIGASGLTHKFAVSQVGTAPSPVTYQMQSPAGAHPGKIRVLDDADQTVLGSSDANAWFPGAAPERKGAAVDAYAYTIGGMSYWSSRFGQKSYDNAGGGVDVVVHQSAGPEGKQWNAKAGFTSRGRAILTFTDGFGARKTPATAPDAVAHELGHVVHWFALGKNLDPADAGAAIDEGLADVFGSLYEASLGTGDPATVGEAAVAGGVRNLADPSLCDKDSGGPCPSNVDDAAFKSDDPHIPGVVVGHVAYLYTYGGEHVADKVAITDPISFTQAETLYFSTVKKCLRMGMSFKELAQCQIEEAKAAKIPFQPVVCAWTAAHVVTADDAKKRYNVSCDGAVSCEGKTNGFYCAPDVTARRATSYKCQGGKVESQDTCLSCVEYHNDRSKQNCSK